MAYCVRCLYSDDHPLGLLLDEDGLCSGCKIHEEKDSIDWAERFERLQNIVTDYRSKTGLNYDCIVPITGARDSYFIVDTVIRRLGLNPLLVSYNRHYNTAIGHRNIAYLRTIFDCDYYQLTLSPQLVKRIIHSTLERFGSFHWHAIAGQTVFPVQCAVRLKVPLIIWGAHQGIDQVGMYSHLDEVEMSRRYRKDHDLMGTEPEDMVSEAHGLPERDLLKLFYPDDREIQKVGIRGIYLGNFIRWDSKAQHENMIDRYGYQTFNQRRTFDTYNDVDCMHYSGLHDLVKYRKLGYGKAVDHATREIRLKRLSRYQAIKLVLEYESKVPGDCNQFFNWLEISEPSFWSMINRSRHNPINSKRFYVSSQSISKHKLDVIDSCEFRTTAPSKNIYSAEDYQLFARGYQSRFKA